MGNKTKLKLKLKMKAILTLSAAASVQAAPNLLNLRNATMLSNDTKVGALETLVSVATFDEVPVLGGEALRSKMLEQVNNTEESDLFSLLSKPFKYMGCQTQKLTSFMLKDSRLQYGDYCDELPVKSS